MKCEDENWRPVAFILKSLNGTERNYKIHDKEILAVIRYLKAQRHFLKEEENKFKVLIDYKNFMKNQKLNYRQARWVLYLSRFDFEIKHVLETSIRMVDSLSR